MNGDQRDRLTVSLAAEPLDASLRQWVADRGVAVVAAACRGENGLDVPEEWADRCRPGVVDSLVERAETGEFRWVVPGDAEWPVALDDLAGLDAAPWGLWVRGPRPLVCGRSVAVVGARSCTTYGAEMAGDIGADLADRDWTVVSGAAFGIDACAHRGALAVGGGTVAVLACGVDVVYPRAHAALLDRIGAHGWIVSEHAPGATPQKHRFLTRNRLIAALSAGTVVVEAATRSGSLNTLHWADRLGRLSMAVPGPVQSQQSQGVHRAIREGEAVLVTSAAEVAEELDGVGWAAREADREVGEQARRALDLLRAEPGRSVVAVAGTLGVPVAEARAQLCLLERRGLARPGADGWEACGEV
ncbi:MAG: DNA-processing protein DprA [Aeromicrobium sp.]|uniref:DNA-processing protein DprA n=1 Tax=Aeromicrobium sp. TaxID=1871063 RepID=UPI0039E5F660